MPQAWDAYRLNRVKDIYTFFDAGPWDRRVFELRRIPGAEEVERLKFTGTPFVATMFGVVEILSVEEIDVDPFIAALDARDRKVLDGLGIYFPLPSEHLSAARYFANYLSRGDRPHVCHIRWLEWAPPPGWRRDEYVELPLRFEGSPGRNRLVPAT